LFFTCPLLKVRKFWLECLCDYFGWIHVGVDDKWKGDLMVKINLVGL